MKLLPVVALLLAPAFTVSIKERLEAQSSVGQYEYVIFFFNPLIVLIKTSLLDRLFRMIGMRMSLLRGQMAIYTHTITTMVIHTQRSRKSPTKKYTGLLALLVLEDQKVLRETKDTKEHQVQLGTQEDRDHKENKDVKVHKAHRALQDVLEMQDLRMSLESKENVLHQDQLDHMDLKDLQATQAPLETEETEDQMVKQDPMDQQDQPDCQDTYLI